MKSVSLAAIFWCILIPSSETSKKYLMEGCYCDCPLYQNISKRRFMKQQIENDCNCLYMVDTMPVPSHDVEEYCRLCDCKSVKSSNTAIMIILIVFLLVFVIILLFNIVLMIVKHFSHKPDAYTNSLHNEEESEDPRIRSLPQSTQQNMLHLKQDSHDLFAVLKYPDKFRSF